MSKELDKIIEKLSKNEAMFEFVMKNKNLSSNILNLLNRNVYDYMYPGDDDGFHYQENRERLMKELMKGINFRILKIVIGEYEKMIILNEVEAMETIARENKEVDEDMFDKWDEDGKKGLV